MDFKVWFKYAGKEKREALCKEINHHRTYLYKILTGRVRITETLKQDVLSSIKRIDPYAEVNFYEDEARRRKLQKAMNDFIYRRYG